MNPASAIGVDRRDALSSAVPAKADTGALSLSLFFCFCIFPPVFLSDIEFECTGRSLRSLFIASLFCALAVPWWT